MKGADNMDNKEKSVEAVKLSTVGIHIRSWDQYMGNTMTVVLARKL